MICFSFVHSFTRFTQYKPCFFLFTLFVNFRLCSRFTFDTSSLYKRRQSEVLSKTKRRSIEHLSKTYRRTIEELSKTYRREYAKAFLYLLPNSLSVAPIYHQLSMHLMPKKTLSQTLKYTASGCERYIPVTLACGYIAPFSVSVIPISE